MLPIESLGHGHSAVERHTDKVGTESLESLFESAFVIFSFTLAETNNTVQVSDEEEDTSLVNPVELGNISD